ncbi:MAG TPA: hypothetical protein VF739_10100 [Ktedonobacterales bacterium]
MATSSGETPQDATDVPAKRAAASGVRRKPRMRTLPPLRIGRARHGRDEQDEAALAEDTTPRTGLDLRPPWYLQGVRLLVGLALLALAWGGVLLAYLLGQFGVSPIAAASREHFAGQVALRALSLGGACFVGLIALGCVVVGAFALLAGLQSRGWQR